ncbi:MAG: PH domain-containing protein [Planctomycetota bacterium]
MPEPAVLRTAEFDPRVKTYRLTSSMLVCLVSVIFIPLIPIVYLIGQWLVQRWLDALGCTLTERTLEIKQGIFNRSESTIPLEKITDLQLHQGWLMRRFGLEGFRVETAGQSSVPGGSLVNMIGIVDTRAFREAVLAQRDARESQQRTTAPASPPLAADTSGVASPEAVELLREAVASLHRIEASIRKDD